MFDFRLVAFIVAALASADASRAPGQVAGNGNVPWALSQGQGYQYGTPLRDRTLR
jgi:hypothetical protein